MHARGGARARDAPLATLRLPDLYLCGYLLEALDDDVSVEPIPAVVTSRFGEIAAGTLRLAHRALQTHAHALGHEPGVWVERALECARAQLSVGLGREERPLVDRVRRCAIALTRAIAATAADAMLVPGELADGLACPLALYLIASTLG